LHVIQSEKQQSDRRCTKQVASWKSNFGSEFTEKFEGDSIDVLHVLPPGENFPPPHGWRKVGGTSRGQPARRHVNVISTTKMKIKH